MISFKGLYTAIITPFTPEDVLDEEGLSILIKHQLRGKVDGIVPIGTTGESPTLTADEKKQIIKICKNEIGNSAQLMVGTGSYSTKQAIINTQEAEAMGADAVMVVSPYYNRPTQEGLYLHFKAIAEATALPLVIYNHLGRTGQNIHLETLKRLAEIPSIIGIKEASEDISSFSEMIECFKACRPDFGITTGNDTMILPVMALGGHGVVSVVANLIPRKMKEFVDLLEAGESVKARELHYQLMPLFRASGLETNPIPIKAALKVCDFPAGKCRLPLCEMQAESAIKLEQTVNHYLEMMTTIA